MAEDRGVSYETRLLDFTCKLFAAYRMERDGELVFNFRNLPSALKEGLEETLEEYEGKEVPESIQEVKSTLRFFDGSYDLECVQLGDILAYSHQIGISHPQPPSFNDERIFWGKRSAKNILDKLNVDEAFLKYAKNVWDKVEKGHY